MQGIIRLLLLVSVLYIPASAQSPVRADGPGADRVAKASELLGRMRTALGGETKSKEVRSLSLTGTSQRFVRGKETTADISVHLLTPDRFLLIETWKPQPRTFLTVQQAWNGSEFWLDRQVRHAGTDDGSSEFSPEQPGSMNPQLRGASRGMRDAASGNTTVRTETMGAGRNERTVLGMPMPGPQGRELDTAPETMADGKVNRERNVPPAQLAENPGIKAAMASRFRKDFLCLSLVWLGVGKAAQSLRFIHEGVVNDPHGNVEAISITGPDDFAATLFITQADSRPAMISYRETVDRNAGYVVSASPG